MDERFGPYRLRRRVGLGGTAEVWLAAIDEPTSRPVAVKRVQPEMAVHDEVVASLVAEGELMNRLRHRNIVDTVATGELDGRPYICMEYAAGGDLARMLASGPLPPGPALRIALDICAALERVHGTGFVHNDVNPTNILLAADGRAMLCDFGVAAAQSSAGSPRGTYAYMAPEQARGAEVDGRTDLFAAGATLWEMLSGRRLFHRDASYLTLTAVVEAPVPPLAEALPELDPAVARRFDRLTGRMLEKRAEARYASAAELRGALQEAAAELELEATAEELASLVVDRAARAGRP